MMGLGTASQAHGQRKARKATKRTNKAAADRRRDILSRQRGLLDSERGRQQGLDSERQGKLHEMLADALGRDQMEERMGERRDQRAESMMDNAAKVTGGDGTYHGETGAQARGGSTANRVIQAEAGRAAEGRNAALSQRAAAAGQLDSLGDVLSAYQMARAPGRFDLAANQQHAARHGALTQQDMGRFGREEQFSNEKHQRDLRRAAQRGSNARTLGGVATSIGGAMIGHGAFAGAGGAGAAGASQGLPPDVFHYNTMNKLPVY